MNIATVSDTKASTPDRMRAVGRLMIAALSHRCCVAIIVGVSAALWAVLLSPLYAQASYPIGVVFRIRDQPTGAVAKAGAAKTTAMPPQPALPAAFCDDLDSKLKYPPGRCGAVWFGEALHKVCVGSVAMKLYGSVSLDLGFGTSGVVREKALQPTRHVNSHKTVVGG